MGVQIYKNGTWGTPTLKRYKNGAWTDITSIKRYINGAWTEILKSSPVGVLYPQAIHFVSASTTYNYNISTDGKALSYEIQGAVAGNNTVPFIITKNGGFGKVIKLRYTVEQTVTTNAYASSRWLDVGFNPMSTEHGMWYNYYSCPETTFEGTKNFSTEQAYIFFMFEAYAYNITGTIKDVYINEELVTFR